jgi:hypothetical protein
MPKTVKILLTLTSEDGSLYASAAESAIRDMIAMQRQYYIALHGLSSYETELISEDPLPLHRRSQ